MASPENSEPLRVAIIGAGIGGLTLAQILRIHPRFDVTVYEKGSPQDASQLSGFRILVKPALLDAMRDGFEPAMQQLFDDAIGVQPEYGQRTCLFDEKGNTKLKWTAADFIESRSVSRWKLRKALLYHHEAFVQFDKQFVSFECLPDGQVQLKFADGDVKTCDLLVGADGAGSAIYRRLVPDHPRHDLGVTVIYFKMPLTPETEAMIPFGSGCMVMGPRKSMIVSYWKNAKRPYGAYDLQQIDHEQSFLMCGLGCYTDEFVDQTKHPDDMTPEELKDECLARTVDWHPLFRSLVAITIPQSFFMAHIKTHTPYAPWNTGPVTMLGDAAHRYVRCPHFSL